MTTPARPGLQDIISAFLGADREADLGHCYDGRELHPGTPEYAEGYAEYLAAEATAAGPETRPVPFTLTPQAEALLAEAGEPAPEIEL